MECKDNCQHWDTYLKYCRKDSVERCVNDNHKPGKNNLYLKWSKDYQGDD